MDQIEAVKYCLRYDHACFLKALKKDRSAWLSKAIIEFVPPTPYDKFAFSQGEFAGILFFEDGGPLEWVGGPRDGTSVVGTTITIQKTILFVPYVAFFMKNGYLPPHGIGYSDGDLDNMCPDNLYPLLERESAGQESLYFILSERAFDILESCNVLQSSNIIEEMIDKRLSRIFSNAYENSAVATPFPKTSLWRASSEPPPPDPKQKEAMDKMRNRSLRNRSLENGKA